MHTSRGEKLLEIEDEEQQPIIAMAPEAEIVVKKYEDLEQNMIQSPTSDLKEDKIMLPFKDQPNFNQNSKILEKKPEILEEKGEDHKEYTNSQNRKE